ncbi:MAG: GPW/gp25 family protein [Deltaproteobacteria bacterium]|nr:GPW/gp25 family protein [Deltaproteobacteria bacterium]
MENRSALPYHRFAFPSVDGQAKLLRCSLEEQIKYALRCCILTQRGERTLCPSLGSEIRDLLFRPMVSSMRNEITHRIHQAIEVCEPRVEVLNVDAAPDSSDKSRVAVDISYRVVETQKMDGIKMVLQP